MDDNTATKQMEKRIKDLFKTYRTKESMRGNVCTWFTCYVQSRQFKSLTEGEKHAVIDRFAGMLKFFS